MDKLKEIKVTKGMQLFGLCKAVSSLCRLPVDDAGCLLAGGAVVNVLASSV